MRRSKVEIERVMGKTRIIVTEPDSGGPTGFVYCCHDLTKRDALVLLHAALAVLEGK